MVENIDSTKKFKTKKKKEKEKSHERQMQKKWEKHRGGISLEYIRDTKFVFSFLFLFL